MDLRIIKRILKIKKKIKLYYNPKNSNALYTEDMIKERHPKRAQTIRYIKDGLVISYRDRDGIDLSDYSVEYKLYKGV